MSDVDSPQSCDLSQLQQELIALRNEQVSLRANVANLLNQLSMGE